MRRANEKRRSEVQNESTESAFEEHEDQLTEERREDEEESLLIDEDQTQAEDADDFRSSCRSSSYSLSTAMSACQPVKESQLNCQEKRNFNLNFYDRES